MNNREVLAIEKLAMEMARLSSAIEQLTRKLPPPPMLGAGGGSAISQSTTGGGR